MFLGYQKNKVTFAAENRSELENLRYVTLDRIEETDHPVALINGVYCIGQEAISAAKSVEVRAVRDDYLKRSIDPVVSNPLRWAEMTAEEQQAYAGYRRYLLDLPESAGFPEVEVLTLEAWIMAQTKGVEGDSVPVESNAETVQKQGVEGDSVPAESEGAHEL